jgi:hypothetical protein
MRRGHPEDEKFISETESLSHFAGGLEAKTAALR